MKKESAFKALGLGLLSLFVAGSLQAQGLLGEDYYQVTGGTTLFDEGKTFDSRELSVDGGLAWNQNVNEYFDVNLAYDYSRITGRPGPGADRVEFHENRLLLSGIGFSEEVSGIRPYASGSVGAVYLRERKALDFDSDWGFAFGVGGGVELDMSLDTSLRLGADWLWVEKLKDGGDTFPAEQEITYTAMILHRFNHEFSGLAGIAFGNTSDEASFRLGLNFHY